MPPDKCARIVSSVTGKNRLTVQALHFTRGFSQTPRTHSLPHAGEYPDLPVARLSKRTGKTSDLPRNNDLNSAILASGGETRDTEHEKGEACVCMIHES